MSGHPIKFNCKNSSGGSSSIVLVAVVVIVDVEIATVAKVVFD